jgi:uncharacterized protein (TIGR00251 family)
MPYMVVKIVPNSTKSEFREVMDDGTQKIYIKSPPEKFKANKELIKLFKKEKNLDVKIVGGETKRRKLLFYNKNEIL